MCHNISPRQWSRYSFAAWDAHGWFSPFLLEEECRTPAPSSAKLIFPSTFRIPILLRPVAYSELRTGKFFHSRNTRLSYLAMLYKTVARLRVFDIPHAFSFLYSPFVFRIAILYITGSMISLGNKMCEKKNEETPARKARWINVSMGHRALQFRKLL